MKRIAITINAKSKSLWSNGINQNAIYLARILKKAGYSVHLVSHHIDLCDKGFLKNVNDLGFKIIGAQESYKIRYNLIIALGLSIDKSALLEYKKKNKNVKLISYKCGNQFIVDMESLMFSAYEGRWKGLNISEDSDAIPDQTWSIPQMENSNLDYYRFLYKQDKATVVPFVWDPIAIESLTDAMSDKNYGTYTNRNIDRIGVLEPNISIMKNMLHPIMTCDFLYREFKFKSLMLVGAKHMASHERLMQILKPTDMFKSGIVTAEGRHPTINILNEYCDIILSWQWENNLNYLYLDVAWMGWPIVHNGNLCKDIGYYYDGFNADMAKDQMLLAINNHNNDIEYLTRNREIIKRYTIENDNLVKQYKELVEDALNNRFKKRTYNWETNSIS